MSPREQRRAVAVERFRQSLLTARKAFDDAIDGIIAAAEEYELAIAERPAPIGEVATLPDRTGGMKMAAEILGVDASTVKRYVEAGKIPVIKQPSARGHRMILRFSERALREWLGAHEVKP